jgi:hypothetical protein
VEQARTSKLKYKRSPKESEAIMDEYIINLVDDADVAAASFE